VRARDLVALGVDGSRWGIPLPGEAPRRKRALVDAALEAVGATAYADRSVGRLRGGEQQRLRSSATAAAASWWSASTTATPTTTEHPR
jgi:zinc/manganese transport system ATP-binding protein